MNKIDISDLQGTLLLATPRITRDPLFKESLVYVFKHNVVAGAEGIILNKPTRLEFYQLFKSLRVAGDIRIKKDIILNKMLLIGGPELSKNVFLIDENLTVRVLTEFVLQKIILGQDNSKFEVTAGLSIWAPGQLEQEIFEEFWLPMAASQEVIFNTPYEKRYQKLVHDLELGPYFRKLAYYE